MSHIIPFIPLSLFVLLVVVCVIRDWRRHRPYRVIYKDGQRSMVMPRWCAENYQGIFGGRIEKAPDFPRERRTWWWKRGLA